MQKDSSALLLQYSLMNCSNEVNSFLRGFLMFSYSKDLRFSLKKSRIKLRQGNKKKLSYYCYFHSLSALFHQNFIWNIQESICFIILSSIIGYFKISLNPKTEKQASSFQTVTNM